MTWEEFYTIVLEAEAAEESSELAAYLKELYGDTTIEEEGVLGGGLAWSYLDDLDQVERPDVSSAWLFECTEHPTVKAEDIACLQAKLAALGLNLGVKEKAKMKPVQEEGEQDEADEPDIFHKHPDKENNQ